MLGFPLRTKMTQITSLTIKMGYIFENLIGRFYQNVDAGQFYTGRDIIKLLVSLLLAEGCDDIFDQGKVVTVCESKVQSMIQFSDCLTA